MPEFRSLLETFENQFPGRDYRIEIVCPEFTSVCPKTGQPDFGTITITYSSGGKMRRAEELSSSTCKATATKGIFYENVTNTILDDLNRRA